MGFPSALTTEQYEKLRGTSTVNPSYRSQQFAVFVPCPVIFKALVNGAPSGNSYAQVSFDTVTVGDYTDIEDGQTVLIGSSADMRKATFVGRVRKSPTSNTLYINETSKPIADNANVWVLRDWRLWDRLARVSSNTQFKDWDVAFQASPPIIYGLQSAYAERVNADGVYSETFSPQGLPVASGATIASWAWILPDGATITDGTDTTREITVEFEDGFNDWVTVKATDSNGKIGVFHFTVAAVARDYSNVVNLNTSGSNLQATETGWSGSLDAFAGVTNLLDGTRVVIFDREVYNEGRGSLFSNVKFVGNIRTESNETEADLDRGLLKKISFELDGISAQINSTEHLPFTLRDTTSPAVWDEIANLSIWRAIAYSLIWHTTLPTLYSIQFDNTDNTYAYPLLPTQGGNILSVIQDLAVSINAVFQHSPTGEIEIVRQAVYQTTSQRNALSTVANFNPADYIRIQLRLEHDDSAGKINASGGSYNTIIKKDTPVLSIAPGLAQDKGAEIGSLHRQILAANATKAAAQDELDTRTGHHYALKRRKPAELVVTMRGAYNWLTPAVNRWYTWTLGTKDTRTERTYDTTTRWLCTAVSVTHNHETGTKDVTATFRQETSGSPGKAPPAQQVGQSPPAKPIVPPAQNYPNFPVPITINLPTDPVESDVPPYKSPKVLADGSAAVFWSGTRAWVTTDVLTTNKSSVEVTPPNALANLTSLKWEGFGTRGLYALSNDGTNSRFHYTTDAFLTPQVWFDIDLEAVVYTDIEVSESKQGHVYIKGSIESGETTIEDCIDLTTAEGAAQVSVVGAESSGDYGWIEGTGFYATGTRVAGEEHPGVITLDYTFSFPADIDDQTGWAYDGDWFSRTLSTFHSGSQSFGEFGGFIGDCGLGLGHRNYTNPVTKLRQTAIVRPSGDDPRTGYITAVSLHATYVGQVTEIAFSSDFGATFAPPKDVTPSLASNVGFDFSFGAASLVAAVGQVMIATDEGGDYEAYGDPLPDGLAANAILLPRHTFAGADNSGSMPQYVVASAALTEDDLSTYRVTSSGATFTDITPVVSSTPGTIVGPNALAGAFKNAQRIAAIFDFDGTRRLMTSANSGTSWSTRATLDAEAAYVRYRRGDLTFKQLYIANGEAGIKVSVDHGANLKTKAVPTSAAIIGIEPYS